MATHPVIDDLDRCKIALQSLAEGQLDSLTVVLELLGERLEAAIGQANRSCASVGLPDENAQILHMFHIFADVPGKPACRVRPP